MTRTATESRVESRDLSALYVFGGAGAFALIVVAMASRGHQGLPPRFRASRARPDNRAPPVITEPFLS